MRTIIDIKKEEADKLDKLFKDCAVFWAFSNEQFTANKTPLKNGEKYVSIGYGGYLPKGNTESLNAGMKAIKKWKASEIKKGKELKTEDILYELKNHECFYTGDIVDALKVLPYSRKDVAKVFDTYRNSQDLIY